MGELAQAAPQLMPIIADKWVGNLDFPGAQAIADRLHKLFLSQHPELGDESGSPEQQALQANQKLQQAMQMVEMMTQELQAKTQIIETDQVKAQRDLQRDQIAAERDIELAKLKANTDAQLETAVLGQKMRELEAKIMLELAKLGSGQMMARAEQEADLLHKHTDVQLARENRDAASAERDLDRRAEQERAEQERQFQQTETKET
jgi:hypothetical protein